jgi:fermentation-respiration switch protein FrsA (DUF1100 family)
VGRLERVPQSLGLRTERNHRPVSMWHGLADKRCPPSHGRWLAKQIPHVAAHFRADDDHTNIEEDNRRAAYAWIRRTVRHQPR